MDGKVIELNKEDSFWYELGKRKSAVLCNSYSTCNVPIENSWLSFDYYKTYYKTKWVTITLSPTLNCNLQCKYCYQGETRKNFRLTSNHKELWRFKIPNFIKAYIEETNYRGVNLVWYGGEPFIEFNILNKISHKILSIVEKNNKALKIDIITNGTILDKKSLNSLKELPIRKIQITLDGDACHQDIMRPFLDGKGTFKIILDNIKKILKETDFQISIRVNISQENIEAESIETLIKETRHLKNAYGEERIDLELPTLITSTKTYSNTLSEETFGKEIVPRIFYLYNKYRIDVINALDFSRPMCTVRSAVNIVIGPNGGLYKCWEHIGEKKYSIGDVINGIDPRKKEDWENVAKLEVNEKCMNCLFWASCLGGCPLYKISNSLPKCPFQKFSIDFYPENIIKE